MPLTPGNALARLHIQDPDGTERVVDVHDSPFDIGRQKDKHLPLTDNKVSRQHARLLFEEDQVLLIDQGSKNGTFVGETELDADDPYPLPYGQTFKIGRCTLRLEAVSAPAAVETQPRSEKGVDVLRLAEPVPEPEPGVQIDDVDLPPPPPTEPPAQPDDGGPPDDELLGLRVDRSRYLQYLPPIYHPDEDEKERARSDRFLDMGHFLLAFEGLWLPIEQMVDNFDLYLDPRTTPAFFLEQLAGWVGLTLDETWKLERRRTLVAEAAELYRRRGTRWSLSRHLAIYAGIPLEDGQIAERIQIEEPEDRPHHFEVVLRVPPGELDEAIVDRIIQANKPAHTTYKLKIGASET